MGPHHDDHNLSLGQLLGGYAEEWLSEFGADTEGLLNSPYITYLSEDYSWFVQLVNRVHKTPNSSAISTVLNQVPLHRAQLVAAVPASGYEGTHPQQKIVENFVTTMSSGRASVAEQLRLLRIGNPISYSGLSFRAMAVDVKVKKKAEIVATSFLKKRMLSFPFASWVSFTTTTKKIRVEKEQHRDKQVKIYEQRITALSG